MKKILKAIIGLLAGKKKYQGLFEYLYKFSLNGMNMGVSGTLDNSGEKFAIAHIHKKLRFIDNLVLFDVGANVGNYTILLNLFFREKAQIFSFEPSKQTYQKLIANTKGINNLRINNFGFSNQENKIPLYTNAPESGLASLYQRKLHHFNIEMNMTEEVEIKTIDGFCIQNSIRHIHFLKIDVEGNEFKVLEGAKDIINSNGIDYIQFEFGGCNIDSKTYFQDFFYLLKDNYKIYRIVKDGLYEIKFYKEIYEVFITTNYLAERMDKKNSYLK